MTNLTLPITNVVKMARLGAALTIASIILWIGVGLLRAVASNTDGFLMVFLTLILATVFIAASSASLLASTAFAHSIIQKFRR